MLWQNELIKRACLLLIVLILVAVSLACNQKATIPKEKPKKEMNISNFYIGTYTRKEGHVDGKATGIYQLQVEESTGKIIADKTVASLINPSFIVLSPNKKYLYAVSELAHQNEPTGFIYAYELVADSLRLINRLPTEGQAPCHVSIDQTGKFAFVANYLGGVAKMYYIEENGALIAADKVHLEGKSVQQDGPHLHSVILSPDNKLILVPDKGTDKIWIFSIDFQNKKLLPFKQPFLKIQGGAGPRHLVWSPKGDFCYVINELDNTINAIEYSADNQSFNAVQSISTLPKDFKGESYCADIRVHPNGQFLYGSNRGHNSIAMYKVDDQTGQLTFIGTESTRGAFPRNFRIGPKGKFLYVANQNTGNITSYAIDSSTGKLSFLGFDYPIGTPVCIEF